jgi:hypothetical protein
MIASKKSIYQKRNRMKLQYLFLMNIFFPSLVYAQHIVDTSTKIKFNKEKRPLFEWIRDHKKNAFGNTEIIKTTSKEPHFFRIGSIKTLTKKDFILITKGHSFYCDNIKKKNKICYGALVINPDQHHFNAQEAKQICMHIRNAYIINYILDDINVPLESSSLSNSTTELQSSEEILQSETTEEQ